MFITNALQYCPNSDFLCIICLQEITLFIRIDTTENRCYLNESGNIAYTNGGFHIPNYSLPITNSTINEKRAFDYVFRKNNSVE